MIKKYTFSNRFYFILATLLLIVCFFNISQTAHKKQVQINNLLTSNKYEIEIIENGGTLWNICKKYKPQSIDLREYIDIVKQYNNISNNEYLQINQQIKLPQ